MTTKEYKEFVLEQLSELDSIVCRPMMGEYLLYYHDILFGGIYNDSLLVKIVNSNQKYQMKKSIPYERAKPMFLIEDMDNKEQLKRIIIDTCHDLPVQKKK